MITRNNYEEYFLLLADNELSAVEAAAVKQFAAQHPDLAEELDMLMSCRLEDTPLPIFPKEKLLRPALWDAENIEPVQAQMLLLLDDELPSTEKGQLEKQIAASTALQADWNSLQLTRLTAEAISYPDKESLQHKERKVRPLLWMRWAAAAAVVAGLGWLFLLPEKSAQTTPSGTYTANNTAQQNVSTTTPTTPADVHQQSTVAVAQPGTQSITDISAAQPIVAQSQQTNNRTAKPQSAQLTAGNKQLAAHVPVIENTPVENTPAIARLVSTEADLVSGSSHTAPALQVAHLSPKTVILPVLATNEKREPFTGNKNDVTAEENDYVTIGGAHVNKQKMRGLFRNVTRTVARSFSKSKMEPDVYATR